MHGYHGHHKVTLPFISQPHPAVPLPQLTLVTATKLNKLRAEKAHTDPLHCYNQTGGGEGKSTERIYDEVGEGTGPIENRRGTTRS